MVGSSEDWRESETDGSHNEGHHPSKSVSESEKERARLRERRRIRGVDRVRKVSTLAACDWIYRYLVQRQKRADARATHPSPDSLKPVLVRYDELAAAWKATYGQTFFPMMGDALDAFLRAKPYLFTCHEGGVTLA